MANKPHNKMLVNNYSSWYEFVGLLPDPYKELQDRNIYELFRNMRKYDAHVKAAYTQRLFNAIKTRWEIKPASESPEDKRRAEIIYKNLDELVTNEFFDNVLSAVPDGFSVIELSYDKDKDGYVHVSRAKHEFPERFGFNENGDLLLKDVGYAPSLQVRKNELYVNLSKRYPAKFIVHSNMAEFSDPVGVAVLAACYWPWTMKKLGQGNWTKLLERFGVPSIAALFKATGDTEKKEELSEAIVEQLQNLHDGAAGAFNDIDDLVTIEASKGGGSDFLEFCRFMNNEISKAFLTETLTLETQGTGSYALGEKHFDIVEQWITEKDVTALQNTLNETIVKWLYAFNWGDAEPCKIVFNLKQKMKIENVIELAKLNYPIGLEQLKNDYYAPIAEEDEPILDTDQAVELSKKKVQINPYL